MASSSASGPAQAEAQVQVEAFPDGTTDFRPMRSKAYDVRKAHITEQPITLKNWYLHVNWLNTTLILIIPFLGMLSTYWVPLTSKTLAFSVFYYFNCGLGITAGELPAMDPGRAPGGGQPKADCRLNRIPPSLGPSCLPGHFPPEVLPRRRRRGCRRGLCPVVEP